MELILHWQLTELPLRFISRLFYCKILQRVFIYWVQWVNNVLSELEARLESASWLLKAEILFELKTAGCFMVNEIH